MGLSIGYRLRSLSLPKSGLLLPRRDSDNRAVERDDAGYYRPDCAGAYDPPAYPSAENWRFEGNRSAWTSKR